MHDGWSCSWDLAVPQSLLGVGRVLVQAPFVNLGSIPQPIAGGVCAAPEIAGGVDLQAWRSPVVLQVSDSQIWDSGMHMPGQNNAYLKPALFSAPLADKASHGHLGRRKDLTCETPKGL